MKWIWIYLLCGQEVWSEPSMGARMVPANRQTTKTKKIFYMSFWLERLSILFYKYIHLRAIFVLEKGGVLLLGTVLLLGHIRYYKKANSFFCLKERPFIYGTLYVIKPYSKYKCSQGLWWTLTITGTFNWLKTIKNKNCQSCAIDVSYPKCRSIGLLDYKVYNCQTIGFIQNMKRQFLICQAIGLSNYGKPL